VVINKDIQVVLFDQEIEFNSDLSIDEFMMTLDSPPILALKKYHHLWFLTILKKWKKPSPKWKSKKLGI
jgi:hypothetical protein